MRATNSGLITLGLLNIAYKMYTSASSEKVNFNQLHESCKTKVKQQYICPVDDVVVPRTDMVKGFEYSKGNYVIFTEEELAALQAAADSSIEILEFVPQDSLNFIQVEKTYYLGPDKAADKVYRVFMESIRDQEVVAVGRLIVRGKERLVVLREHNDGLLLHQMYYGNEVRAFENTPAKVDITKKERELCDMLIGHLTVDEFDNEKYYDRFSQRVREAADQKIANKDFVVVADVNAPPATVDMNDALEKSLAMFKDKAKGKGKGKGKGKPAKKKAASKKKTSKRKAG